LKKIVTYFGNAGGLNLNTPVAACKEFDDSTDADMIVHYFSEIYFCNNSNGANSLHQQFLSQRAN